MLLPEPYVLVGRLGFADAQQALLGSLATNLGYFEAGWYGTNVNDERGSFGIVSATSPLVNFVGDVLNVRPSRSPRSVNIYILASSGDLDTDLAMARRPYLAISRYDVDPVEVIVSLVTVAVVPG